MPRIRLVLFLLIAAALVSCKEEQLTLPTAPASDKATASSTSHRRHATRYAGITFTGRVMDSVTGGPAANVRVEVGNTSTRTDANGYFNISTLPAGAITASFSRFGLVSASRDVQLTTGYNVMNLTMQGKPVIRLTDISGHLHLMDQETSHFVSLFALLGYQDLDSFNFCRSDGSRVTVTETSLALVTGPGRVVPAACCSGNGMAIRVTTKAAETLDVNFADCTYYHVLFRGNNRESGSSEILELDQVQRIEYP